MIEERSKKEIFRHENNYKRMCRIHKYVNDLTSFDEGLSYFHRMKKHSSKRFKEITKRLREESKKRKEKKELRKQKTIEEKIEGELFDGKGKGKEE